MPSSNGVYSLPPGYVATTGATILISQHNPVLEDIAAALTARLSRDGTAPMTGGLKAIAGTAAVPGYTFSTDPTSGFLKTTNGIGVSVGGVQVAEFLPGGINGARVLGEIVPYSGRIAPPLWVLPYGQTLSRTTYAALWTFAQAEITAGNTLYNNGDGSTTFGIPDMRGRVPAGWDTMGGVAASRLTTAGSAVDGSTLGVGAGGQNQTLTVGQLPTAITSGGTNTITVAPPGSNSVPQTGGNITTGLPGSGSPFAPISTGTWAPLFSMSGANTISVTSTNTGGNAHPNVQPTLVCNYLLFAQA